MNFSFCHETNVVKNGLPKTEINCTMIDMADCNSVFIDPKYVQVQLHHNFREFPKKECYMLNV